MANTYSQSIDFFTATEEKEIFSKLRSSKDPEVINELKEEIVRRNIPLVKHVLKICNINDNIRTKYFDDLIQEGSFGLLDAINKFDISYNFKFSTYAVYWIKRYIKLYTISKLNLVRVPENKIPDLQALKNLLSENPEITDEKISKILNLSSKDIINLKPHIECHVSLNTKLKGIRDNDGEDVELLDRIYSFSHSLKEVSSAESYIENVALQEYINTKLLSPGILKENEIFAISLRFGFKNGKIYSLQQIADEMNITHQGVSYIIQRAIKKISKQEDILNDLKVFIEY